MKILDSNKLYKGNIKILDTNDIVPVIVYKKGDYYFDMRFVNSTLDFNKFAGVYYTSTPSLNTYNGLIEYVLKDSLERFYKDRESFNIDDLHEDMQTIPGIYTEEYHNKRR